MEELKKLYEEQFKAIKSGNYPRLNEINKQIFAIREEKRKADKKARQQERYYVAIDLQCGEFGMNRNYTLSQWRKQAIEWCYMDENDELAEYIYNIKDSELLTYIGEMWTLVFRKCRKDKKNFSRNDLTDFEDETLDEFVRLRFTFLGE